jgi:L-amino acid N-acyltransferase YncA
MIIRLATEDDAAQILEIYAPFCRETTVSFETEPPTLVEMRRRIAYTLPSFPWLVCDENGLIRVSRMRASTASARPMSGRSMSRSTSAKGVVGADSGERCTHHSSPSCGSRAITTP